MAMLLTLTACGGGGTEEPVDAFALDVVQESVELSPGETETLTVNLTREDGFDDAVAVTVGDLPAGVTAGALTIAADATTGALALTADADAAEADATSVTVTGTAGDESDSDDVTVSVVTDTTPEDPEDPEAPAPGDADEDFGSDGTEVYEFAGTDAAIHEIHVLDDGSMILAGTKMDGEDAFAVVAQVGADGTPDADFGNGGDEVGFATTQLLSPADAMDLRVTEDAITLAVAYPTDELAGDHALLLLTYDRDGQPTDVTGDGVPVPFDGEVTDVDFLPSGRVLVAGWGNGNPPTDPADPVAGEDTDSDFAIARFTADGDVDGSFSNLDGVEYVDFGSDDQAHGVEVFNEAGDMVLFGHRGLGDDLGSAPTVVRVNEGGDFVDDGTFGGEDDRLDVDFLDDAFAATRQGDNILLGGSVTSDGDRDFAIVRFDASGELDTAGFGPAGDGGEVSVDFGGDEVLTEFAMQEDGSFLAAGISDVDGAQQIVLARFGPTGTLDTDFSDDGKVVLAFTDAAAVHDVATTEDRVLVAGETDTGAGLGAILQ